MLPVCVIAHSSVSVGRVEFVLLDRLTLHSYFNSRPRDPELPIREQHLRGPSSDESKIEATSCGHHENSRVEYGGFVLVDIHVLVDDGVGSEIKERRVGD